MAKPLRIAESESCKWIYPRLQCGSHIRIMYAQLLVVPSQLQELLGPRAAEAGTDKHAAVLHCQ